VIGVTISTAALIIVLSAFNGFDNLLTSLNNSFDPDLKVTPTVGKVFSIEDQRIKDVKNHQSVLYVAESLEENAMLKYSDQQNIATIKGVSDNYTDVTGLDTMLIVGDFILKHNGQAYAVVGHGVAVHLSMNINYIDPIVIFVPKRNAKISTNPKSAFKRDYIFPSAVFSIQQEFDGKYVIVPIEYARELYDYPQQASALEIKLKPNSDSEAAQKEIHEILGPDYEVKNRFQQHEAFYKVMKTEKFFIFLMLTFIFIIASFNIFGSLTMLMIDKKDDINTFRNLGANLSVIRKVFLLEGWLITIVGAIIGLCLGSAICWLQIKFQFVRFGSSGSFLIDAYPIKLIWTDFVMVFVTVVSIGYVVAWYPVRYITKRFVSQESDRN
jgi:lipoprotein-releasing system permease protein